MAKKQKKATPERTLTKRQLSKWQRQVKIRKIVIIAAIAFLAGILIWVGIGYYKDRIEPWQEVVITVDGTSFTMGYYVKTLDVYTAGMNSTVVYLYRDYFTGLAADAIIEGELLRQGAKSLGIEVTDGEIDAALEARGLPDDRAYRDMVSAILLQEELNEHFDSQLPDTMEQANIQIMLVESQEVADEVIGKVEAGSNFTALVGEFSCNSSVEGDLGWLPRELMPNRLVADVAFNVTLDEIKPVYDETATKSVGYWLIEVTEKEGNKINARAMLLGSEEEADRIRAELISGGNFSALAANYSRHESKTKGGKLDGLERGDIGSSVFDLFAFSMPLNEVSEPVKDESVRTAAGYWLIRVIDRGERELGEQTREDLVSKQVIGLSQEWKENSTIENLLNAARKTWAINEVLRGR